MAPVRHSRHINSNARRPSPSCCAARAIRPGGWVPPATTSDERRPAQACGKLASGNHAQIHMPSLPRSRRMHMENIWGDAQTLLHDIVASTYFGRFRHVGGSDRLRRSACRGQLRARRNRVPADLGVCLVLRIRRRQDRLVAHPCQTPGSEGQKACKRLVQAPTLVSRMPKGNRLGLRSERRKQIMPGSMRVAASRHGRWRLAANAEPEGLHQPGRGGSEVAIRLHCLRTSC